jgi:hypothetical protein
MKHIFILIAASVIVFAACKKANKNYQHCYVCYRHDSVVQNFIPLVTVKPIINDTLCKQTDITIQYYISTHQSHTDTLWKRHDSLSVEYYKTVNCEVP